MGFLSGVLGAVKDDEAVKTYDEFIEGENNRLEKVLEKLQSQIGSGREGLVASVGAVKRWLEGYGKKMGDLTKTLNEELTTLKNTTISNKIHEIHNSQSGGLKAINDEFQSSVTAIDQKMSELKNNKNGHFALDYRLKCKLELPFSKIDGAIELLKKSAGNGVIAMQAKMLDEALVKKEKAILTAIEKQYTALKITSEDELWKVRQSILTLESARNDVFKHLDNALKIASRELLGYNGRDFDNKYKNKILARFEDIKDSAKSLHKNISTNRLVLYHLVNQARDSFNGIKEQVGKLGDEGEATINGNWGQLIIQVKKLAKEIYGVSDSAMKNGHLGEIVTNIGEYATAFSDAIKFVPMIEKWIDGILHTNEVVMGWIQNYLDKNYNGNPSQGEKYTKLTKIIANAITAEIKRDVIEGAVAAFEDTEHIPAGIDSISAKIAAVKNVTEIFVALLGQKMKLAGGIFDKFAAPLVKKIERRLISEGALSERASAYKSQLPDALLAILTALQTKAQNVSDELTSFTGIDAQVLSDHDNHGYNLGKYVSEAINKVELIGKEFDNSKQSRGEKIGAALATVDDKITELDKLLTKSSGEIDSTIEYIKGDIESLDNLKKEKDELNKEDGEINKHKDTAAAKLDELKEAMQNKLKAISQAAYQANDAVTHTINLLKQALDKAYEHIIQAILELQTKLTQNIQDAFNEVTKQVRLLFATQKIADLNSLKELIGEQHVEIMKLIDEDTISGTKGLLNKIESWFPHNGSPVIFRTVHSFESVTTDLKYLSDSLLKYMYGQVYPNVTKLDECRKALDDLLTFLLNSGHFDFTFKNQLASLMSSLDDLHPTQFSNVNNPLLLDVTKHALSELTGELGKAYVNMYDSQKFGKLVTMKDNKVDDLTLEGKNLSNVFLTVVDLLFHDLEELRKSCGSEGDWNIERICLFNENVKGTITPNPLGFWFSTHGFEVSKDGNKQTGELDRRRGGNDVIGLIAKNGGKRLNDNAIYEGEKKNDGKLNSLHEHLETYFRVNHYCIPPNARAPTTVYEMLQWFCGLWYNPVRHNLMKSFVDVFGDKGELDVYVPEGMKDYLHLPALYPSKLIGALQPVCTESHSVLTSILGHGNAAGRYACEFYTNRDNLLYPADFNSLLCQFFDILKRLYHQLYFLREQCSYDSELSGWSDCWYGNAIGGSNWRCNYLQCPDQIANQKHNQRCDQKCDQNAECGIKSPLQSYLEDGLPGFLPHPVRSEKGKLECTVKSHFGIPCKTPMGFADISQMASHRQTGRYLSDVLDTFCGDVDSPLSKLYCMLNTLLPSAPKSLGDMFAFYYNFLHDWYGKNPERTKNRESAYFDAVNDANFKSTDNRLDVTAMFKYQQHEANHASPAHKDSYYHNSGDLYSISCPDKYCYVGKKKCGPYMNAMSSNICGMFSPKNAASQLSWTIYITESFADLLRKLMKDCESNCATSGSKCRITGCHKECNVFANSPGISTYTHRPECDSLLHCRNTLPTLYKYGFVFGNRIILAGETSKHDIPKRSCCDFVQQLQTVTGDSSVLSKIIYETIPTFLWHIRLPFFWTTVALWLLSFLYLLHIMVIRLDLLHIKSHLHSPSSHRIAAQSLLAAGRVNKLNRVFYLQP